MSIVLSILQILGIVLLILLGVFILLLLLILFLPISYQVEGNFDDTTQWVKAKVSWLLHLIRARVSYENDLIYGEARIIWKKITFSYDMTKKAEDEEGKTDKKEPSKEKKKKEATSKTNLKDKIRTIKTVYPRIKAMIKDARNKKAVAHLKDELIYLVKIFLPKKSKVDADFSTGAPDTTGQLCGVLACFPIIYQKNWKLRPDFTAEGPMFRGSFWGKGRIYLYKLVGILLRIVFDKNCIRMYTMINKLMKTMKSKPSQEEK